MSAFGITKDEVKQLVLRCDLSLDPETWDDADAERLAREIRKETKPILVAANKMDTPEAQANYAEIVDDPDYEHLTVVPTSAHAEKSLKRAAEAGVVDYLPGDGDFDIVGDVSDAQATGLEKIREVVESNGGTGVQEALNTAVYDVLDMVTAYPVQNETKWTDGTGEMLPDAFLLERGSTPADLAYAVHSDIGDGYLHAVDARSARRIGEDYELDEGDVIKIVSTAN